jgi:hypothetical protein
MSGDDFKYLCEHNGKMPPVRDRSGDLDFDAFVNLTGGHRQDAAADTGNERDRNREQDGEGERDRDQDWGGSGG